MSQHSIKILKNQSKQQKVKRFIKLSSVVLGMIISGGILIFYLLPDTPVSFDAADETKDKNIQMQTDLQEVEITTDSSDSKDNFEHLFNHQDKKQIPLETSNIIASNPEKKTVQLAKTEKTIVKELNTPHKNPTKINIPQKVSIQQKDISTKIVKQIPSTKIKTEQVNVSPTSFNQPLKIDSLDAIILLELDTFAYPSVN